MDIHWTSVGHCPICLFFAHFLDYVWTLIGNQLDFRWTLSNSCPIRVLDIYLDEPYEFIDKDRFKVSELYYNFLEHPDADDFKKSEKILLSIIKKDPYFFDPYTVLHEYYLDNRKYKKAFDLMFKGYKKAMELISQNGKFPDFWDEKNINMVKYLNE